MKITFRTEPLTPEDIKRAADRIRNEIRRVPATAPMAPYHDQRAVRLWAEFAVRDFELWLEAMMSGEALASSLVPGLPPLRSMTWGEPL